MKGKEEKKYQNIRAAVEAGVRFRSLDEVFAAGLHPRNAIDLLSICRSFSFDDALKHGIHISFHDDPIRMPPVEKRIFTDDLIGRPPCVGCSHSGGGTCICDFCDVDNSNHLASIAEVIATGHCAAFVKG